MSAIIAFDELKTITGYKRRGDVERCLRDQGIKVFCSKNGPWTTVDLVNQAGGFKQTAANDDDQYRPEDLI